MKNLKYIIYTLMLGGLLASCEQEIKVSENDPCPSDDPSVLCPSVTDECPEGASPGSADFTKFVAVGNSFVAGVQGGALFTAGQNNSLAAILNKQFECVGASNIFNQPSINASLGWNLFVTQPILSDPTKPILGRMLLQYGGSTSPKPTPQAYPVGNLEALPNPSLNPGFMYTGSKTALNNFAVPAIILGQAMTPATGGPAPPAPNPAFTPFYLRFASSPSPDGSAGSSIISDAKAAGGSFFLVWLGMDDFFLHAAFGADPSKAPLTDPTTFGTQYGALLLFNSPHTGLLTANANSKAVVGNFPGHLSDAAFYCRTLECHRVYCSG